MKTILLPTIKMVQRSAIATTLVSIQEIALGFCRAQSRIPKATVQGRIGLLENNRNSTTCSHF